MNKYPFIDSIATPPPLSFTNKQTDMSRAVCILMNPFISIYFHSSGIIISICTTQHFNIDIRYNTISLYKYSFRINPWNLIIKHIKITNILLEFENIMLGISHKFLVGKNSVLRQIYLKYVKLRKIFSNMLLVI